MLGLLLAHVPVTVVAAITAFGGMVVGGGGGSGAMGWYVSIADQRFLVLYWVLVAFAVVVAVGAPVLLPKPRGVVRVRDDDVGPYELAMLAGGPRQVVDVALSGLLAVGAARVVDGKVVPATGAPADGIQRFVLSRICHRRALTHGRDDLGVSYSRAGRALTRRLLSLGYLARPRVGRRLHWLLAGVMAFGLLRLVAVHGFGFLADAAVIVVVMLAMLGMLLGFQAIDIRWSVGKAVSSRRLRNACVGLFVYVTAMSTISFAPPGQGGVMTSIVVTAGLWVVVRAVLRRLGRPVPTPRGRAVVANVAAREPHSHVLRKAVGASSPAASM